MMHIKVFWWLGQSYILVIQTRTFHAKMGIIKDRYGTDLREAEDIRRGAKNTQKNYTKRS